MRHAVGQMLARMTETTGRRILATNPKLVEDLSAYLEKTRSTGCSYADFGELYRTVRTIRPAYVLELGTGASTIVIAHALEKNGAGRLISMEESEEYYRDAQSLLPPHLASRVEICHSPAVEKTVGFFRGSGYRDIPDYPYGFVFVDGPAYLTNPNGDLACNIDLLEVLKRSEHSVSALIDTRHSSCYVYALLFGSKFRYDYIRKLGVLLPSTQRDLRSPKQLVISAFATHLIKRPPLISYIRSFFV